MSNYQRVYTPKSSYFFTVVTWNRRKWFDDTARIESLKASFRYVMSKRPFQLDAIVVLPDHLHCIWTMTDDSDFSTRWQMIKTHFSRTISTKVNSKGAKQVWQPRFWEHLIRDDKDYQQHLNYIHYNPVKHGLVTRPEDWEASSYQRFVDKGYYKRGWGWSEPDDLPEVDLE